MSKVKRYIFNNRGWLTYSDEGDLMLYEDYKKLAEELKKARVELRHVELQLKIARAYRAEELEKEG